MTDIVERLRSSVMWYNANAETIMEAAAEIERLRARLEIDPSHPYDGIYARDETIRQQDKQIERLRAGGCARDQGTTQYCGEAAKKDAEIASLLNTLADARTESMRLRAALKDIASGKYSGIVLPSMPPQDPAVNRARAALGQEKGGQ